MKKSIINTVIMGLFSSSAMMASGSTESPKISTQTMSCQQLFRDPLTIKPERSELKAHGISFTLGTIGLITSVTATALTAGLASPGTLALGGLSIGLMTGGVGAEGYFLSAPVKQYLRNIKTDQLISSARAFRHNPFAPESKIFTDFYQKHFPETLQTGSQQTLLNSDPSQYSVAGILGYMNQKASSKLCEQSSFEGKRIFRYQEESKLVTNIKSEFKAYMSL